MRDPDLVNPGWERPPDWKWDEDWNSPKWKRKMAVIEANGAQRRLKFGFIYCPACKMGHTNYTITCRNCGHQATIPDDY
jgi:hypothetical protein